MGTIEPLQLDHSVNSLTFTIFDFNQKLLSLGRLLSRAGGYAITIQANRVRPRDTKVYQSGYCWPTATVVA
jgi:hypothetical protein